MSDILGAMFGPIDVLARHRVHNFIVSTVLTRDEGYETAVLGKGHASPVRRYPNEAEALAGHIDVCREVWENGDKPLVVKELGGWGVVPDEERTLKPMLENEMAKNGREHPHEVYNPEERSQDDEDERSC